MDDNTTDRSATSGVTVLAGAAHVFRIEFIDINNVEFYIDGNELVLPQTRFLEDSNYSQSAINKLEESFKQLNFSCYHCGYPIEKDTKVCPD